MSFRLNKMIDLFSKIKVNPLFWVVIGIGVATGYFREMTMVFTIVFIHELGHAVAASFFKWNIKKIELLPFGGVAEVDHVDAHPFREEAIVILFGPLQHVFLITLSYFFLVFPFWTEADHRLFVWHNIVILSFNLLPILPLDGGRLMQLYFLYRFPYVKALHYARVFSLFMLTILLFITIFLFPYHLNLLIVLSFLIVSNYLEWKQRHFRFIRFLVARYGQKSIRARQSTIAISAKTPLREVVKRCRRGYVHQFKLYEAKTGTSLLLHEKEILKMFLTERRQNDPIVTFFSK